MSRAQGRPKRESEDYARTHHDSGFNAQSSKKPRFDVRNPSALAPDALEEDEVLEADVIGKRGQQVRRNAVNVDGYDSDSDNENFDARADAKAKAQDTAAKSKDEDENDMFADLEEDFKDGDDSEGDADRRGGKKKAVKFLDEDQIEGQVTSSKSGGHVSADFSLSRKGKGKQVDRDVESSSESEVDDETRAEAHGVDAELGAGSKKLHAPKLDAFNMSIENQEGRFDDQGNYVRKAVDPDAVHDTWMEGISKKDMKKAKDAHEKRVQERRQRDLEDDATSTAEVLTSLIPLLEPGETVLEALARLGKSKDKKPKWQQKRKTQKTNGANGDSEMSEADPAEAKRKQAIEAITAAADMLLRKGQLEVYEAERELLMRQYKRETGDDWTGPDQSPDDSAPSSIKTWQYRWSDARDGGQVHGPYDGPTMKSWNDAGYFGEGVEFQEEGNGDSWSRVVDFI